MKQNLNRTMMFYTMFTHFSYSLSVGIIQHPLFIQLMSYICAYKNIMQLYVWKHLISKHHSRYSWCFATICMCCEITLTL